VGRSDFLDICSSGSAVGRVCAVSYQNQYCEVFSGRHPGRNHRHPGGAPVARLAGLRNVAIESTPGMLSDHYGPRSKTLRLSQEVYFAPSVAAAGIAAYEAGHALQDAVDYFPLEARTYIVPVVQLASQTAPWLFIAGVMLQLPTLAWVGVILFGASSVFALITLPVEFNASARAQELLIR